MKLPWDKKYLTISFHVIFTFLVIYVLVLLVDSAAFTALNPARALRSVGGFFASVASVFASLIIAFVIAYLFDPAVDFFERHCEKVRKSAKYPKWLTSDYWRGKLGLKMRSAGEPRFRRRTVGAAIVYLIILSAIALIVALVVRKIGFGGDYAKKLSDAVSGFSNRAADFYVGAIVLFEKWGLSERLIQAVEGLVGDVAAGFGGMGASALAALKSVGGAMANILIGMVAAFYFMRDKERIKSGLCGASSALLPRRADLWLRKLLSRAHMIFSGYIRGQLLDAVIMSGLVSAALIVIGVDFAVPIGVFSGFTNFIPYFGSTIGLLLAGVSALMGGSVSRAVIAVAAVIILQQIDTIFIIPRVVGERVRLSPAVVLISLAVAARLFGLWGMVFAVPVTAMLKFGAARMLRRSEKAGAEDG